MVKAKIALLCSLAALCACSHSFKWERYQIDGHRTGVSVPSATNITEALGTVQDSIYTAPNGKVFIGGATASVAEILTGVQPAMARLKEVIAYAPEPMEKHHPESNLTNFIVDRLFADVQALCDPSIRKVDLAFCNYGGIRCDIPAGNVLLDDVVSMLPFKNFICYLKVPGRELRNAFEYMATGKPQCVSGAKIVIRDHELVSVEIGGEPLDDERYYGLATIDFLLDGGDGYKFARGATDYFISDIRIGDAILADIRALTAEGKPLEYFTDGRIVIQKD